MALKDLKRYNDIISFILKYGQKDLVHQFESEENLPKGKTDTHTKNLAKDLAHDLEQLGPFFVKLGQIFSTQASFLPDEYHEALQKLQDKATPMPYEECEAVFKEEFGKRPEQVFKLFNQKPVSAASIGQVHFAELLDGTPVAVKIQRKGAREEITEQLEILEYVANFFENKTEWGKKYHVIEKYHNLKKIMMQELDYLKEADNLRTLRKNLSEFPHIVIPEPVGEYTTSRVLTMQFIKGKKITELTPLEKINLNTLELADEVFRAYLKQILEDGFFQMDPHPGNIYVTMVEETPMLVIFDLGMVSTVPFQMQGQLMRFLFATSERREEEVTRILISMGKKLDTFDEYYFKTKISDLVGSYNKQSLSQVPIGRIILNLARAAAEAGLWLPIQFSTIGKTLLSLDPVIKALNPEFEPNKKIYDNSYELMTKRVQSEFTNESFYSIILEVTEFVQQLPGKLNELISSLTKSEFKLKLEVLQSEGISKNYEKIANRITISIILAALLVGAALMMRVQTPFTLFGYPGIAMIMFLLGTLGSLWLIFWILQEKRKK